MGRHHDPDEVDSSSAAGTRRITDEEIARLSLVFFTATTKMSGNPEDILPQEDSDDCCMSVFATFASLFPEAVGSNGASGKNKRMRLHFNQLGYSIYGKEQSRRVPAVRAKPGNPGYGFRKARWRDTLLDEEDRKHCEKTLLDAGCDMAKVKLVAERIQELGNQWDSIRRPSRPAGPGRPRRSAQATASKKDKKGSCDVSSADSSPELHSIKSSTASQKKAKPSSSRGSGKRTRDDIVTPSEDEILVGEVVDHEKTTPVLKAHRMSVNHMPAMHIPKISLSEGKQAIKEEDEVESGLELFARVAAGMAKNE